MPVGELRRNRLLRSTPRGRALILVVGVGVGGDMDVASVSEGAKKNAGIGGQTLQGYIQRPELQSDRKKHLPCGQELFFMWCIRRYQCVTKLSAIPNEPLKPADCGGRGTLLLTYRRRTLRTGACMAPQAAYLCTPNNT